MILSDTGLSIFVVKKPIWTPIFQFCKTSDDELLKYYQAAKDFAFNEKYIMAMVQGPSVETADQKRPFAMVFFGKPEYLFPYFSLVIEDVDGQWKALRSLTLLSDPIHLCPNSFGPVSFREKVSSELIAKLARTLHVGDPPQEVFVPNEVITESDIVFFTEAVLRLRGIEDYCDFRIDHYTENKIELIIGRYLCEGLTFQKYHNKWVLVSRGTCFYY